LFKSDTKSAFNPREPSLACAQDEATLRQGRTNGVCCRTPEMLCRNIRMPVAVILETVIAEFCETSGEVMLSAHDKHLA